MKKVILFALSTVMTAGISASAFAGGWQVNNRGWWYLNDDWTWPASSWETIDGKNYYFDADGYMAESQFIDGRLVAITGEEIPTAYGNIIREYIDCSLSQDPDAFRDRAGIPHRPEAPPVAPGLEAVGMVGAVDLVRRLLAIRKRPAATD